MATAGGGGGGGGRVQRIMTQPINLIFRFLQQRTRVQVWLFGQTDMRMEGRIAGFDEYMNLVLDEAEEVYLPTKGGKAAAAAGGDGDHKPRRKALGRVLLKGDTITLMQPAAGGGGGA
jgi:small nuclear ribonucleoprotein E